MRTLNVHLNFEKAKRITGENCNGIDKRQLATVDDDDNDEDDVHQDDDVNDEDNHAGARDVGEQCKRIAAFIDAKGNTPHTQKERSS